MSAGLGQVGPELGAIRVREPAHLRPLHPEDAFGGLEGAVLIPIAIAAGRRVALVATAAEDVGGLPFSRLLYHPLGSELHERTQ